jgi:hypothetical protein
MNCLSKIFFLFIFFLSFDSIGQNSKKTLRYNSQINIEKPFTKQEKAFIVEAYSQDFFVSLTNKPGLTYRFKDILRNRVNVYQIVYKEKLSVFPNLSDIPIFKAYNSNLLRDVSYNKNTFNILKYNFNFDSKESYRVRIDNTNYIVSLMPQKNN